MKAYGSSVVGGTGHKGPDLPLDPYPRFASVQSIPATGVVLIDGVQVADPDLVDLAVADGRILTDLDPDQHQQQHQTEPLPDLLPRNVRRQNGVKGIGPTSLHLPTVEAYEAAQHPIARRDLTPAVALGARGAPTSRLRDVLGAIDALNPYLLPAGE